MNKWNASEDQILCTLKERGVTNEDIAREVGRSKQAVINRWQVILGKKADVRAPVHRAQITYTPRVEIPDALISERNHRTSLPRTLTAHFFGDPPPGYSALDRKRQEART